jgi:hypothetical protein
MTRALALTRVPRHDSTGAMRGDTAECDDGGGARRGGAGGGCSGGGYGGGGANVHDVP